MRRMLVLVSILSVLIPAGLAHAQEILVECEWFNDFEDLGGLFIQKIHCASASNDSAVAGYDAIGEWVRCDVTFALSGSYDVSLRSAGLPGVKNQIYLTLVTDESPTRNQTIEVFTLGYGIG